MSTYGRAHDELVSIGMSHEQADDVLERLEPILAPFWRDVERVAMYGDVGRVLLSSLERRLNDAAGSLRLMAGERMRAGDRQGEARLTARASGVELARGYVEEMTSGRWKP